MNNYGNDIPVVTRISIMDQSEKSVVCFRPPLTPPNLGVEDISLSIPFPLLS